jgi:cob(I)alamin adenosyltransferase
MPIYTKKGDKGETGLYSSDRSKTIRVSKSSLRIEAIGSIDEANTMLGLAASFVKDKKLKNKIFKIQERLFEVGAILAGANLKIASEAVTRMEEEIDEMDKSLKKLTHFILPGGGFGGAHLFLARTFVRRAERTVVALSHKEKVDKDVLVYLNRLSDYVYTLARYSNFKEGVKEKAWRG